MRRLPAVALLAALLAPLAWIPPAGAQAERNAVELKQEQWYVNSWDWSDY